MVEMVKASQVEDSLSYCSWKSPNSTSTTKLPGEKNCNNQNTKHTILYRRTISKPWAIPIRNLKLGQQAFLLSS